MDDLYKKDHTKEAKDERGEVFTPEYLVEDMLKRLPEDFFTSGNKTILDNSVGNGNFLVKVLQLRINNKVNHIDAISSLYGIELDPDNAKECKQRLSLGSKSKKIWEVLNHNIICADALDPNHKGWAEVGYMWDGPSIEQQFFDFS